MADVTSALRAMVVNTEQVAETKQQLTDINQAMQAKMNEAAANIRAGTTISSRGVHTTEDAILQSLTADLQAQNINQERMQKMNHEATVMELMGKIKEHGSKALKAQERVAEIEGGNFFEQVAGMFEATEKEEAAAAHVQASNIASDTLAKLNQHMQTSAVTTAAAQTRITEASITNLSNALAADKRAESLKLEADSLYRNSQGVAQIANLNEQQLGNVVKAYQIRASEEERGLRREQMLATREARHADLMNKLKGAKLDDQAFEILNIARKANGLQPFPPDQKELQTAQLNRQGPAGEQLRELLNQGFLIASTGKVVQGDTPAEAAEFRSKIGYVPSTEQEEHVLDQVDAAFSSPEVRAAKGQVNQLNEANRVFKAKLDADQNNISIAKDSLTKPATYANLATSKAMIKDRVWREVISPSITDNISTSYAEPQDMYERLVASVVAGKATISEAASTYNKYAQYSVGLNNELFGLEKLTGLRQSKFIARLPQPKEGFAGFFGKLAEAQSELTTGPITLGIKATTGLDAEDALRVGPSSTRTRPIDGLDIVEVNNALAKSVAARMKKDTK